VKRILGPAVLALALALAAPGWAQADTGYGNGGEFANGAFSLPTKIAIDDTSGNVLAVDYNVGVVRVYSGWPVGAPLGSFGEGELSSPYGIAVDQSKGDVYVTDSGHNRIFRYSETGAIPPTYALDPTYVSPTQGSGPGRIGSFASAIAVDPRNGDLLVADTGGIRVERFDSGGAFLGSFDGAGSGLEPFASLLDIAVAPNGEIYLIRDGHLDPEAPDRITAARVERLDADGSGGQLIGAPGELKQARSLAFDPHHSHLVVATGGGYLTALPPAQLSIFHAGALIEQVSYSPQTVGPTWAETPVGLAVDGGASGALYALTARANEAEGQRTSIQAFVPVSVPTVEPPEMNGIGNHLTTAHFIGTVEPAGRPTSYRFEYAAAGVAGWTPVPGGEGDAGSGAIPVGAQADLTLAADSEYRVRLVVSSEGVIRSSLVQTFSTLRTPLGSTTKADHFSTTSAILRGSATPRGVSSTYRFEYGTSVAYGLQSPPVAIGAGEVPLEVAQVISGLQSATTYHYRLTAESAVGADFGEDNTFTTLLAPRGLSPRLMAPGPAATDKNASKRCRRASHTRKGKGKQRCAKHHRKHTRRQGR
jgi:DNA-binding beta-propeller fold protein YncE